MLDSRYFVELFFEMFDETLREITGLIIEDAPELFENFVVDAFLTTGFLADAADLNIEEFALFIECVLKDRESYYESSI